MDRFNSQYRIIILDAIQWYSDEIVWSAGLRRERERRIRTDRKKTEWSKKKHTEWEYNNEWSDKTTFG